MSVCLAILKKAIVAIPLLIMIVLYLIRCNMTPENQTEPTATPNETKNVIIQDLNLTLNDTQNLENEEIPRCEISGFCFLSFRQNEGFLSFLSLYILEESLFIFQFLNDRM